MPSTAIDSQIHGPVNLGRLPALDRLQGPCRNADLRDPAANWAEVVRYARCSSGTACLAGNFAGFQDDGVGTVGKTLLDCGRQRMSFHSIG